MQIDQIPVGKDVPNDINVFIEIPAYAAPVKYELDKDSNTLFVDRFLSTAMFYPANYGFIPQTLSDDGDPVDVLVLTPVPLMAGCVVRCRPVAILNMQDEAGEDAKLIAVPVDKLSKVYSKIAGPDDIAEATRDQIVHFFEQYKALEPNKWVKITGWADAAAAKKEIEISAKRYTEKSA